MRKDDIIDRVEDTAQDVADYGHLQLDSLKLRLLESFATLFNNIFSVFVLVIVAAFALMFIAAALTLLLAELVGSMLVAVLIMAGVFIIVTLIVYALRKKLIINSMVRMLGKLMFEKDKD